jgi:ParB family transcriptional regulator, chromosome partitioning protein
MTIHKLKLNSCYYADSASGIKTFEIRKNDRDYKVGDVLELREWIWSGVDGKGTYTGEVHWKVITYILNDEEYLHDGYVCLAVSPIAEPEEGEP